MSENFVDELEPTEAELSKLRQEFSDNLTWANSLSTEQINFLCDGGWYNNTIRGYLITAAKNADFTAEQIKDLLNGLHWALDEKSKTEADKVSNEYKA